MAEQNPIRYQDLISPDDSIEKLIGQLEELQKVYTGMVNEVKTQAETLASSLTKVSGANEKGRKSISTASEDAKRLEKAYKQLDAALSANAKDIARLNAVRREANNYNKQMVLRGKEEIATRKQIKEASYQQLSAQYSLNKAYINSLTATDRLNAKNRELIKTTKEIYEQMKKLQADTGKMQLNVGNYPSFDKMLGSVVGISGTAAGAMAAINALKSGIGTAMDYQQQLSGLAAILGTFVGKIKIPLSNAGLEGTCFSLTTTGGCLLVALIIGHFGRVGKISLMPAESTLKLFRELGLVLFLVGAGIPGGADFVANFNGMYFVYGIIMTVVPMIGGFFFAKYVLKLPLLNNLGSLTGGMTSTPALGTLINVAKTEDVAAAYAATYPIALIAVVLVSQFLILMF